MQMLIEDNERKAEPSVIELLDDAIAGVQEGDPSDEVLDDLLLIKQLLVGKEATVKE